MRDVCQFDNGSMVGLEEIFRYYIFTQNDCKRTGATPNYHKIELVRDFTCECSSIKGEV